jgi:hypothetical protein
VSAFFRVSTSSGAVPAAMGSNGGSQALLRVLPLSSFARRPAPGFCRFCGVAFVAVARRQRVAMSDTPPLRTLSHAPTSSNACGQASNRCTASQPSGWSTVTVISRCTQTFALRLLTRRNERPGDWTAPASPCVRIAAQSPQSPLSLLPLLVETAS